MGLSIEKCTKCKKVEPQTPSERASSYLTVCQASQGKKASDTLLGGSGDLVR